MKNAIHEFDIKPIDAKSFYGKATGFEKNGKMILKSYSTFVCGITAKGKIQRYWNDYSATTMRHINAFLVNAGFEKMSKAEWLSLPIVRFNATSFWFGRV